MNKINLQKFQNTIRKCTIDQSFEMTRLTFEDNRIKSAMITPRPQDLLTKLDMDNDVIIFENNPHEPVTMNLLVAEMLDDIQKIIQHTGKTIVEFQLDEVHGCPQLVFMPTYEYQGREFAQRHSQTFVNDDIVDPFVLPEQTLPDRSYFAELPVDEDLLKALKFIVALSRRFEKIYYRVIDGTLYFDTTDANNHFESVHMIPVLDNLNAEDSIFCFEAKNFSKLLNVMTLYERPLTMGIDQIVEKDSAMIHIFTEDKKENYIVYNRDI